MIKVLIGFGFGLSLVGCSVDGQNSVTYEKYRAPKSIQIKTETIKKANVVKYKMDVMRSIRGDITELTLKDGFWHYRVRGRDVSNQKLSSARFTYVKKVGSIGDFVYALIKDGKAEEIYMVREANYQHRHVKKSRKIKKINKHKVGKRHQILAVPEVESISL